mmetsp:Transcript_17048/g.51114  ORF Transcript_17048/g.51114 Transcript_17048/m.51114 type:complete len:143 (+) Transcript_17048:555-983(+)
MERHRESLDTVEQVHAAKRRANGEHADNFDSDRCQPVDVVVTVRRNVRRDQAAGAVAAKHHAPRDFARSAMRFRATLKPGAKVLHGHCGQLGDAVLGWRRALRILTTTHGDGAPLVQEAARSLREAELELSMEYGAADEDED